jgi:glycosyltransferase involved in cell wall biosynthesis
MKSPKVSICIPAYRQPEYLKRILDSVQIQTYTNYEIVLCDDSPDNSVKDLVDSYPFKNNLRYYKNNSPLGSPENWNESVRKSQGEYIKILHHDDWFSYDNSLAEFVKMLDDHPKADFAFSAALVYNERTKQTTEFLPSQDKIQLLKQNPRLLFFGNLVGPPSSTIFRRKLNLTFDRQLKWVVDLDFYIQAIQRNNNFVNSEKTLITSTTDAGHQITNECIGNKCVELREYTYLYHKLKNVSMLERLTFFKFFLQLLKRYQVRSINEIKDCGYIQAMPVIVKMAVFFNKFIKA